MRAYISCLWLGLGVALAACTADGLSPGAVGETREAQFTNGGFEVGAAGMVPPAPWVLTDFLNLSGVTIQTPQTYAGLNLVAQGPACTTNAQCTGVNPQLGSTCTGGHCVPASHTIILNSPTGPGTQSDPTLGATASLRWPRYGNQCALVNQLGNHVNANQLAQTMTVGATDVDPTDGQVHIRFVVAPVLEDPGHPANQQPYFFVQLTNLTQGGAVLYSNFNFANQPGVPWKGFPAVNPTYRYTDWQLIDVAPGSPAINMGDQVQLVVVAAGCSLGAHMGEVYVDGVGTIIPGLFVAGTGPAQANAGTDITYTLSYRNGSAAAASGVTIIFNTPPSTTYQSMTPPAGATCVTPPVGTAGVVTCSFTSAVAAGASGSFSLTVNITAAATGTVVAGNYQIASSQETALLGNKITTIVGCTLDAQCPGATWCHESAPIACTARLANGTAIPSDPPHTGPTLNGTCTAAAGALVCTSGVCDTLDNKCGYLNGDGSCNGSTAGTVCRSAACDPDGRCGYAIGDGPCTAATGAVVCRSGACSVNGTCTPAGGCNVDADCAGGAWCNESTHTCTPRLANGSPLPSDPAHTSPTLDGTCTPAAGLLVCVSGVCDGDHRCGYANGDGPCTPATAAVCRSGACSVNGTCEPAGGCNVDGDCSPSDWCVASAHTCTPRLANAAPLPTDPGHDPVLDGACTPAAGAAVCQSAVCDAGDSACGYANGHGPCDQTSGGSVCRSGACSVSGTCEPAGGCNVDGDCPAAKWCDETAHQCVPTVANGDPLPTDPAHTSPTLDGTCTAAAAALVCASGACAADNRCGYANGDGPCTDGGVCRAGACDAGDNRCGYVVGHGPCVDGAVCRSGVCSTNGTCAPVGGCNADLDCLPSEWCNETTLACAARVANGAALPVDAAHAETTLDGTCTAAAGALVCASGVCDTDGRCGLRNGAGPCTADTGATVCRAGVCDPDLRCGLAEGDGPCTTENGATRCRSGRCSASGVCALAGGCYVDADCTGGEWCQESAHTCAPQLANGAALPTDAPHTSPTLDGTCTAAAAALVCVSAVCDPDGNVCGIKLGHGTCTATAQCLSGVCVLAGPQSGRCEQCATSTDCAAPTPVCDPATSACVAAPADDGGVPADDGGGPADDGGGPADDGGGPADDGGGPA
ncbi:MAG TPA: hypothetical protein VGQ83_20775, partial [Polyangia bacterium]